MSSLKVWVAVTISPCSIKNLITSADVRFSFGAISCAVLCLSKRTIPSGTAVSSGDKPRGCASIGCSSSVVRRLRPFFFGLRLAPEPGPRFCSPGLPADDGVELL